MEALYDQEGTMCLSTCDPDEQLERCLRRGDGYLFEPDKLILQALSNFHFFQISDLLQQKKCILLIQSTENNMKIDIRWK